VSRPSAIVLDWRPPADGKIFALAINGRPLARPRSVREHLVIPARNVRSGVNEITLRFRATVQATGTAVSVYRDGKDGAEYVYSLFVPSDASTVFPCFDQPDLKARFRLTLDIPSGWDAVANSPPIVRKQRARLKRVRFDETQRISTYVFAFAAGPFAALEESDFASDAPGHPASRLFVRRSRVEDAKREAAEVFRLNRRGVVFLESYFDFPFPFPKYDLVLLPDFPYGGMEHAGATFLREESILLAAQPTAGELANRAQLIFHETAHQWFGDLVTMRWFDDLWLKEGFANFMAAKALDALLPELPGWASFRQLKVAAYRTDTTRGTTALFQRVSNLAAAKSAYGPIVYGKAPAVLRQAEFYLGAAAFQRAVRLFLREQAHGVAGWLELVRAFERASGHKLAAWAEAWIKRRGVPRVEVRWRANAAQRITHFELLQSRSVWPMRIELILRRGERERQMPIEFARRRMRCSALAGQPAPRWVFANHGDYAYGRFLLDDTSRAALLTELDAIADASLRAVLLDALWEDVRDARLAPVRYIELALRQAHAGTDEVAVASTLGNIATAVRWYLSSAQRAGIAPSIETHLRDGMLNAKSMGLRITFLRAFVAMTMTADARAVLRDLLAATTSLSGMVLGSRDRFRIVERLLALGDSEGEHFLAREVRRDGTDDARRYAFAAAAARCNPMSKARVFAALVDPRMVADSWVEESLGPFNTVEHAALTAPYLARALAALPRLKRARKIFFVNRWLAAFLGGQTERASLVIVRRHLRAKKHDPDLRRKLLEHMDSLERTVKIRAAFDE